MRHACRDAHRISRATLLVALAVPPVFGCANATTAPRGASLASTAPTTGPPRWAAIDDARHWPSASESFISRGHGVGHYRIDVHVAPPFLDSYRALVAGQTAPVGTAVAAFHQDADTGTPSSVYVMRKRTEDEWEFFVTEPDGRIVTRSDLSLCATCHSEAPADHLFGVHPGLPVTAVAAPSN